MVSLIGQILVANRRSADPGRQPPRLISVRCAKAPLRPCMWSPGGGRPAPSRCMGACGWGSSITRDNRGRPVRRRL